MRVLRAREVLGKYRVEKRLASGGFADVYAALDKVEGIRVALKVPHPAHVSSDMLDMFRREVRLTARLDHPGILPIKNAEVIDGVFVVAYPLGIGSLADRMKRRITTERVLHFAEQMLTALAHAHRQRIIHCDVKPENFILFPGDRIRLADFGISRVARRTVTGSGSGTVGYLAPEQALGRPSRRSDVFSLGLIVYRMLAGELPHWPFDWPPAGIERVAEKVHPDVVSWLRRSLAVYEEKRFASAETMLDAFQRLRSRNRLRAPVAVPARRRARDRRRA